MYLENESAGLLRDMGVVSTYVDPLVVTPCAIMKGAKGMKAQPSCDNFPFLKVAWRYAARQ